MLEYIMLDNTFKEENIKKTVPFEKCIHLFFILKLV